MVHSDCVNNIDQLLSVMACSSVKLQRQATSLLPLVPYMLLHTGSVLLVPGVGVQVSTTFTCGYSQCKFYPWKIVSNVVVNEVFTMVCHMSCHRGWFKSLAIFIFVLSNL